MADFAYAFTKLSRSVGLHEARRAVLWPILGQVDACEKGQLAALQILLARWRGLANDLYRAGWNTVAGEKGRSLRLQLVKNCWPSMGILEPDKTRPEKILCCRTRVCPFCYGRKVMDMTVALRQLASADNQLAGVRFCLRETDNSLNQAELVKLIEYHRDNLLAMVDANARWTQGVAYDLSVTPSSKRGNFWSFQYRLLLVQQRSARLFCLPRHAKVKTVEQPLKEEIGNTVAFVMRYPVGLFGKDVARTAEILNAQHKLRLAGCTGVFRGLEKPTEREEDRDIIPMPNVEVS